MGINERYVQFIQYDKEDNVFLSHSCLLILRLYSIMHLEVVEAEAEVEVVAELASVVAEEEVEVVALQQISLLLYGPSWGVLFYFPPLQSRFSSSSPPRGSPSSQIPLLLLLLFPHPPPPSFFSTFFLILYDPYASSPSIFEAPVNLFHRSLCFFARFGVYLK